MIHTIREIGLIYKMRYKKPPNHDFRKAKKPAKEIIWLYGIHPVNAALTNPNREIISLMITENTIKKLRMDLLPDEIKNLISIVDKSKIDSIVGEDKVHQGIIVETKAQNNPELDDIIKICASKKYSNIIILDNITDPHNIGAISRSAYGFEATAIILPKNGAPLESGTMAKAASGALDLIPILRVTNLNRSINILQKNGFWSVGLESKAKTEISDEKLPNKCLLILGSEGRGIRKLVRENCDTFVRLPVSEDLESLNVSTAASIAMYEWQRQIRQREQ